MDEYEYKAFRAICIKNAVVIVMTGATVVALFSLSHSWHALWALLLSLAVSNIKTSRATEKS